MARLAILSSEQSEEGDDEEMDEHNSEAGTVSTGEEATPRNTIGTAVENEYKKCASVQVERNDVQTENIAATVEKVLEDRLLQLQSATIANGARIFKSTVDDLQSLSSSIKNTTHTIWRYAQIFPYHKQLGFESYNGMLETFGGPQSARLSTAEKWPKILSKIRARWGEDFHISLSTWPFPPATRGEKFLRTVLQIAKETPQLQVFSTRIQTMVDGRVNRIPTRGVRRENMMMITDLEAYKKKWPLSKKKTKRAKRKVGSEVDSDETDGSELDSESSKMRSGEAMSANVGMKRKRECSTPPQPIFENTPERPRKAAYAEEFEEDSVMKAPLRADKIAKVSMTPALGSQNHTFHFSSSLLKSNDHVKDMHGLQQLHKSEEYDNEGGDFFDDKDANPDLGDWETRTFDATNPFDVALPPRRLRAGLFGSIDTSQKLQKSQSLGSGGIDPGVMDTPPMPNTTSPEPPLSNRNAIDLQSSSVGQRRIQQAELYDPPSLLVFQNLSISKPSLTRLGNDEWYNDEVMNIYVKILQDDRDFVSSDTFVALTHVTGLVEVNSRHVRRRQWKFNPEKRYLPRRVNLFDYEHALFPCHVNNNHWALVIITSAGLSKTAGHREIWYLDPLGGDPDAKLIQFYRELLSVQANDRSIPCSPSPQRLPLRTTQNLPRQQNLKDCGPFVLNYIHNFLYDPAFFLLSLLAADVQPKIPVHGYRKTVREAILSKYIAGVREWAEDSLQRLTRSTFSKSNFDSPPQTKTLATEEFSNTLAEARSATNNLQTPTIRITPTSKSGVDFKQDEKDNSAAPPERSLNIMSPKRATGSKSESSTKGPHASKGTSIAVTDTTIPYSQLEQELAQVYDKAVETLKSEIAQAQKNQEAGREQEGTAQRVLESAVSGTLTVEERRQALKKLKDVKKLIAAASDEEMKAQAKLQEVVVKRGALSVSMIGDEDDDDA